MLALRLALCTALLPTLVTSCAVETTPPLDTTSAALTFGSIGAAVRVASSNLCWTHTASGSTTLISQQPCVSAPQAWFTPVPAIDPSYFEIRSGNRCLDVMGNSTAPNTALQLYPCTGNNNQQFRFTRSGGPDRYEIRPKLAQNLCLDIAFGDSAPGRLLQQFTCHGGANQRFHTRPVLETIEDTCDQSDPLRVTWSGTFDVAAVHVGIGEVWHHPARVVNLECDGSGDTHTCPTGTSVIEVARIAPERVRARCYQ